MNEKILPLLTGKLVMVEPRLGRLRRAAVSVILRDTEAPSMLLIKRADRAEDPWSGQVAFPGGKAQDGDATLRDTAMREAYEEVRIDLAKSGEFLGYFMPFRTHTGAMDVVPSVFLLRDSVEVHTNEEVSSYRWVKLEEFVGPKAKAVYRINGGVQAREMPAFLVSGYTVWGLTHRIISSLLDLEPEVRA